MPCPAHRYDTLLSACIYIGAIEPSARVPDTNLNLLYIPSRSSSLPLRSSHTLAYIFTVRGCAACASTTIHIAHRHHVALSGRQLPSHSVVAPLTHTSAGVMRTITKLPHSFRGQGNLASLATMIRTSVEPGEFSSDRCCTRARARPPARARPWCRVKL